MHDVGSLAFYCYREVKMYPGMSYRWVRRFDFQFHPHAYHGVLNYSDIRADIQRQGLS